MCGCYFARSESNLPSHLLLFDVSIPFSSFSSLSLLLFSLKSCSSRMYLVRFRPDDFFIRSMRALSGDWVARRTRPPAGRTTFMVASSSVNVRRVSALRQKTTVRKKDKKKKEKKIPAGWWWRVPLPSLENRPLIVASCRFRRETAEVWIPGVPIIFSHSFMTDETKRKSFCSIVSLSLSYYYSTGNALPFRFSLYDIILFRTFLFFYHLWIVLLSFFGGGPSPISDTCVAHYLNVLVPTLIPVFLELVLIDSTP